MTPVSHSLDDSLPSLVGADAAIQPTASIAVETQHLVRVREPRLNDQSVETTAASAVRSTVLGTIISDVVDRQKERFCLAATGADGSVVVIDLLLEGKPPTSSVGCMVGGISVYEVCHLHSLFPKRITKGFGPLTL